MSKENEKHKRKTKLMQESEELFGEMRSLTEEESKIMRKTLESISEKNR